MPLGLRYHDFPFGAIKGRPAARPPGGQGGVSPRLRYAGDAPAAPGGKRRSSPRLRDAGDAPARYPMPYPLAQPSPSVVPAWGRYSQPIHPVKGSESTTSNR